MAEKHLTDGTTALAAQPRIIKIEAAEKPRNAQLRVAAYTRVSSDPMTSSTPSRRKTATTPS